MTRILWLDNRHVEVEAGIRGLEALGYTVIFCDSEQQALGLLAVGPLPDIIIQDIHRPTKARRAQAKGVPAHSAGWRFYIDALRPSFPQIPVVICSFDAGVPGNLKLADDFNLILVDKHDIDDTKRFASLIEEILASRLTVLSRQIAVPHVVTLDFDKINSMLIRHLAKHPSDLHRVSWSSFEALVARLLSELGYEVVHTPLSRDGGVDLWALRRTDLGEILYAIDAKKYSPNRIVGPEPVRAIYGVADLKGASAGMIVTTANFGPAAHDLAKQYRYRISLKDFDGVVEWIRAVALERAPNPRLPADA